MEFYAGFTSQAAYEIQVVPRPLPKTDHPVHILGKQYSTHYDYKELMDDITSRIWMTYRRGFAPIGGVGPTCDQGWGCMLRCGQMMLAQALVNLHLGRDWSWTERTRTDPAYCNILHLLQDTKSSCYSIHQITAMGVSEGKAVGQWFGPNTIAQVLRKLSSFDEWSNMVIHVSLDSTVIKSDIRACCKTSVVAEQKSADERSQLVDGRAPEEGVQQQSRPKQRLHASSKQHAHAAQSRSPASKQQLHGGSAKGWHGSCEQPPVPAGAQDGGSGAEQRTVTWRPLLLMVPLRLGLSELNDAYCAGLKVCLSMKQSVGIIGGSPNHALWFIGYFGEDVIFLDPHTTQPAVAVGEPASDESYHCLYPGFMKMTNIDPSLALGFFCRTEAEFDDLCQSLTVEMTKKVHMFEITEERPGQWRHVMKPAGSATAGDRSSQSFTLVDDDKTYDSDESYEIIDGKS